MNKSSQKIQQQKLRTGRQSTAFAIQEAVEVGEILKRLREIFDKHHKEIIASLENRKILNNDITIRLSGYELGRINGALRDYVTLRIANIFDSNTSALSLKNFDEINFDTLKKIPEIKEILDARDNWIGHINRRYIGPVNPELLYSKKVVGLLKELEFLVCTESIKEKQKKN